MKPTFKYMVQGYSGKCDGLVYYYNEKLRRTICRKLGKCPHLEQHDKIRSISQNLSALELSEAYKLDLQHYTFRYTQRKEKDRKPITSWYSVFLMIMWAMAKQMNINLATITREQIENDKLPCRTVKQAVEAGFIPVVRDYEWLTNVM